MKYRISRMNGWYAGLFVSLLLAYLIPVHAFLFGSYLARGIIVGTFYSLPLFFAGVIFAGSIARVAGIESAFASNMIGAAIGGMLESASYLVGLKAVVLIALFIYMGSWLTLKKIPLAAPPGEKG